MMLLWRIQRRDSGEDDYSMSVAGPLWLGLLALSLQPKIACGESQKEVPIVSSCAQGILKAPMEMAPWLRFVDFVAMQSSAETCQISGGPRHVAQEVTPSVGTTTLPMLRTCCAGWQTCPHGLSDVLRLPGNLSSSSSS